MLPGTSLEASNKAAAEVEAALLSQPEVATTAHRTGRAPGDPHAQEVFASEIEATLKPGGRERQELLTGLREATGKVPGVQTIFGQPISHRIDHILSGARANVVIKIFTADSATLGRLSRDVQADTQSIVPYLRMQFRRADLANAGISVKDAADAVSAAIGGAVVGSLIERPVISDVVVRYDPAIVGDGTTLDSLMLSGSNGQLLPLSAVADIIRDQGPNAISRESVEQVQFGIATRNGVMLVSHVQHVRKVDGITDLRVAVARASEERLIPILMTALAAGLALVPLALALAEPGSEIQTPMAIVILFGLASSTALNMLCCPLFISN